MLKTAKQRGDIKSNEVYLGAERGFRRGQRWSAEMFPSHAFRQGTDSYFLHAWK